MMAYQQKPGDISVFAETDKKNDRSPDWKGSMIIPEGAKPGDKLEVALWAKGDKGTMLAGSVKFPNQRNAGPAAEAAFPEKRSATVAGSGRHDPFDLNDDIPF
jgi:hypothetical protein